MVEAFTKYSIFNPKKCFKKQFLTSSLQTKPSTRENWPKVLDEDISEENISEDESSEEDIQRSLREINI